MPTWKHQKNLTIPDEPIAGVKPSDWNAELSAQGTVAHLVGVPSGTSSPALQDIPLGTGLTFQGGALVATGLTDAPSNGTLYGRSNGAWQASAPASHTHSSSQITDLDGRIQVAITAFGGGIAEAPSTGVTFGRKNGGWVAVPDTSHTHVATQITDFPEAVDDRVATLLKPGTGITLNYNDALNTLTITASAVSGVSDGDKGDITVSGGGATFTIDNGAVTYAKMQGVATNTLLGRSTAGTGTVEEIPTTSQGRQILASASFSSMLTTIGAAPLTHTHAPTDITGLQEQVQDWVGALLVAGTGVTLNYNDAANTLTINSSAGGGLTDGDKGDIVVSGSGGTWMFDTSVVTAAAKTLLDDTSTTAMLATLGAAPASHTHPSTAITDITTPGRALITAADAAAQTALLGVFTSVAKGLAPASGGGTANFLRADGAWAPSVGSIASTAITDSTAAGRAMLTAATAAAQTALLGTVTSTLKGLAPPSGGGTANFLRADATWAAPPGGGGGGGVSLPAYTLTNVTTDRAFDADSCTIDEVADIVGTLITDIIAGGGSGGSGSAALAQTRSAAAAATIDVAVKALRTLGYATAGDGGDALYKRIDAPPTDVTNPGWFRSVDRFKSDDTTDATNGGWWQIVVPHAGIPIECFGGKSDWESFALPYTDNLAAYNKAQASLTSHYLAAIPGVTAGYQTYKGGPTILFGQGGKFRSMATDDYNGRGSYGFSGPIVPDRTVTLRGPSSASIDSALAARCVFPAGSKGVVLLPIRPDPAFPTDRTKDIAGAYGSCLEDIYFSSVGFGGSTTAHGCEVSVYFITKNCSFTGFGGDGYHIAADVNFGGNANLWRIYGGASRANARHGIYCQGGDANAGYCYGTNVSDNGYWGVRDDSFLGNTWVGLHADGNGVAGWDDGPPGHFVYQTDSGSYKTGPSTCSAAFIGCYHEENQNNALVNFPAIIAGGNLGEGHNSGTGHQLYGRTVNRGALKDLPGQTCRWGLGDDGVGPNADMLFSAMINAGGEVYPYTFIHDWRKTFSFQNTDLKHIFDITTMQSSTVTCGRSTAVPQANMIFPAGVFIGNGDGSNPNTGRQVTYGSAAPTTGAHAQSEIVFNTGATAGGFAGWICTTGGTPGTWKTFGAISP